MSNERDNLPGIRTPELLMVLITATADTNDCVSSGKKKSRLIYDQVIWLHRLCLQHVFTLQVLSLELHQRVEALE